jgi:hypothetical protein
MHGELASTYGYHTANAAVDVAEDGYEDEDEDEDEMAEATIGSLAKLAMATTVDCTVVSSLTEANSRLVAQLDDRSTELKQSRSYSRRSSNDADLLRLVTQTNDGPHFPKPGQATKCEATKSNNMGGSQANKE